MKSTRIWENPKWNTNKNKTLMSSQMNKAITLNGKRKQTNPRNI